MPVLVLSRTIQAGTYRFDPDSNYATDIKASKNNKNRLELNFLQNNADISDKNI